MSSELTISPALLQAISQTLTTVSQNRQSQNSNMASQRLIKQESSTSTESQLQQVAHIIQTISANQPVVLNQGSNLSSGEMSSSEDSNLTKTSSQILSAEDIKAILKWKLGQTAQPQEESNSVNISSLPVTSSVSNFGMINVLTALASQQLKAKTVQSDTAQTVQVLAGGSGMAMDYTHEREDNSHSQPMILCYDNNRVPSPGDDVVVTVSANSPQMNMVPNSDQSQQACASFQHNLHVDKAEYTIGGAVDDDSMHNISASVHIDSNGVHSSGGSQALVPPPGDCCPICGDLISGYHYGIFTCESCKGFFKRTVQNKKSFTCHRKGECEVTKSSRKKCPSCRFTKCLQKGMKLEGIRKDRMRGGRSSYDGCSPHGRPKYQLDNNKTPKVTSKRPKQPCVQRLQQTESLPVEKELKQVNVMLPSGENIPGSQLVAILNCSGKTPVEGTKPFVPHLLTEIMNVESYLCEDENSSDLPTEGLSENDPAFMLSLLQVAEMRLYKLVRWARNLPQFSSISTDDQILLLQNCWADLLLFNCCMRSIQSTTEIFLPMGKSIDMEKAERVGHGAEGIVSRLLSITEQLRRLQVDQYEFVALKVLMLISPDVKALKEPQKAREHQEAVCEALSQYTIGHYPQLSNKFGEMLLRLPEITRVSMQGKDILNSVMPAGFQSCGLLFELLKGDGIKEES